MNVYKFGGASISTVENIKNVGQIIGNSQHKALVIVVSAMGKTTNALEKVVNAYFAGDKDTALQLFEVVKQSHLTTAKYLLVKTYNETLAQLIDFFTEVEWMLYDKPVREFDYYYDQVVCIGELLSSSIVSAYLKEIQVANTWIDVRDVLRTDDNFRDANIDFDVTSYHVKERMMGPLQNGTSIVVTQGFVGSTDENESTTLGREGSDYTAAILANLLNAESITIFKDVDGVLNADPKVFKDAVLMKELSFNEVIEMAYYGAQVIHPKTIKPLQNKKIPLLVKSFINPQLDGTCISSKNAHDLPTIRMVKEQQVLVHLRSLDFSFVGEKPMSDLYEIFAEGNMKPNLIQTGAISIQICMDDRDDKINFLAEKAGGAFDMHIEKGLTLLTVRHYNRDVVNGLLQNKMIVLEQKSTETIQVLYK